MFEEAKQVATAWGVKPTFTNILYKKKKKNASKYFGELSSDERLLDAEHYFETQFYFRILDYVQWT